MQVIRRYRLFHLWLAGTLIYLLGTGIVMRPDRDAAQYLSYQHVGIDASDLQSRQLVTHIRLLQGEGLTLDQVKSRILSNGPLTNDVLTEMIELNAALSAKDHAKERLTLFATVALLPPLIILELGAALIWVRRGYRRWTNFLRKIPVSGNRWSR